MSRNIYSKLWKLAGYNPFLMDYCPTLYNKAVGIGIFFVFQLLIVFVSVITSFNVYFPNYLTLGLFIGLLAIFIFYKWIELLNRIHHKSDKIGILVAQLFFNSIFSLIISVPFWLYLFEHQILYKLYLNTGKMSIGKNEQVWLMPKGLYESWFLGREGIIIFSICIALFLVIAFIYTIPYFFIFSSKNSIYKLVKRNYEQNFIL
ncbi:MAG: hypothetical protein KDE33_09425 [Bacteroidetes bacterium]|nr:hypothetical protein [Bacteroidota bacterium]